MSAGRREAFGDGQEEVQGWRAAAGTTLPLSCASALPLYCASNALCFMAVVLCLDCLVLLRPLSCVSTASPPPFLHLPLPLRCLSTASPLPLQVDQANRAEINSLYQRHNPEKLPDVEALLVRIMHCCRAVRSETSAIHSHRREVCDMTHCP